MEMEQQQDTQMKECKHCHRTLPVTEFSKNSRTSDGLQCYCKHCQNEINKASRRNKRAFSGGAIPTSPPSPHANSWPS